MNNLTRRWTWLALVLCFAASPGVVSAQDEVPKKDPPAEEASPGSGDESDELTAADDIFLPSEEIEADSEISFPSDI